jgi:hypothetical protein
MGRWIFVIADVADEMNRWVNSLVRAMYLKPGFICNIFNIIVLLNSIYFYIKRFKYFGIFLIENCQKIYRFYARVVFFQLHIPANAYYPSPSQNLFLPTPTTRYDALCVMVNGMKIPRKILKENPSL